MQAVIAAAQRVREAERKCRETAVVKSEQEKQEEQSAVSCCKRTKRWLNGRQEIAELLGRCDFKRTF